MCGVRQVFEVLCAGKVGGEVCARILNMRVLQDLFWLFWAGAV
jgi:hypothetical protein